MITITQSVGRGGRAKRGSDVLKIQKLLNKADAKPELVPDSKIGTNTIRAIEQYQSGFMKRPDGRIDPGGESLRRLNGQGATMGNHKDKRFSDFTPANKLIKRYRELQKQGKTFGKKILESEDPRRKGITKTHIVKFRRNFNAFADDVAYLLKHHMIYRSDGGHRARGIVRANRILKVIHDAYLDPTVNYKEGQELYLRIILVRVRDSVPPNRWVMAADFRSPIFQEDWEMNEGDTVVAPTPCNRLETLFALADFQCVNDLGIDKAKKVRLLIDFSQKVGCPKSLNLWFYNRRLLKKYTSWRTFDKDRVIMTRNTGGKLPLDGRSVLHVAGDWRVYPFKQMVKYVPSSSNDQGKKAAQKIYTAWNQIDQCMAELQRNAVTGHPIYGMGKVFPWQHDKAAKTVFGLAAPIFKHIHNLRKKGSGHLYSCFPVTK